MSVSLMLQNKATGEFREVPVASQSGFEVSWLQFCRQLGLQLVPMFSSGALTSVPDEFIPEIVRELRLLLAATEASSDSEWIAESIRGILTAFAETNPSEWEYSFG
jgi:hypothetical protein